MAQTAVQTEHLFDDLPVADLGTISVRVFVLPPKPKTGSEKEVALPLDLQESEAFLLDEKGATPVSSYLESSRGKRCVVYLVNGQRQEFDDNGFIVHGVRALKPVGLRRGHPHLRNRLLCTLLCTLRPFSSRPPQPTTT